MKKLVIALWFAVAFTAGLVSYDSIFPPAEARPAPAGSIMGIEAIVPQASIRTVRFNGYVCFILTYQGEPIDMECR